MQAMQPDFSSVGFFHFGKDHDKPLLALEAAIADFKSTGRILEDALIVLPEAFNKGTIHSLANSCTGHLKSFVTEPQGEIIFNAGGNVNQIVTASLTHAPLVCKEMAN
jgi:hypothetical protein